MNQNKDFRFKPENEHQIYEQSARLGRIFKNWNETFNQKYPPLQKLQLMRIKKTQESLFQKKKYSELRDSSNLLTKYS